MADLPTLFITNWSSRKLHGPGRRLSIMAAPRRWEHGDGDVPALTPALGDLLAVKHLQIGGAEYRRRFEATLARNAHEHPPGRLYARNPGWRTHYQPSPVRDGDTLLCACAREAAARGSCHRVWASAALVRAGWRVVLDGEELTLPQPEIRP